jgi:hypothetical protein
VNNGSSDACGIKSLSVSPATFTCASIGANTVTLTVTDNNNNVSSCQAIVTVNGSVPAVTISSSNLPDFCQGTQLILTANVNQPVTYNWSTGGTAQSINVFASGSYNVTVTNANGCTATASKSVTYSATSQLSSYVIVAQNSVDLNRNTVNSGGVGVNASPPAKAQLKDGTMITAPGTFVKAPSINLNGGSVVTTQISGAANPPLPPFISYPAIAGGVNINTANGSTTTLSGNNYGDVHVGENATVIFTQPTVYLKQLHVKKNGTVQFTGCTNLVIKDKVDVDENMTFNPNQYKVTVYAESADVGKGSTVYANLYVTKDLKTKKSSAADPTRMYGLFIADKVNGDDYTYWNFGTFCNTCTSTLARTAPQGTNAADDEKALPQGSTFMIKTYPNPFSGEVHLRVYTLDAKTPVSLKIFDASGHVLDVKENISYDAGDVLIGKSLPAGIYLIQVTQGKDTQVERVLKIE